ncbi:c-type cytochrome [Xanthobacter variabilis]|uniref:c-type cytochrome n=1 Tax=Xanthobacter variabilis TaxID=3119932 RepID=UPI00372CAFFB
MSRLLIGAAAVALLFTTSAQAADAPRAFNACKACHRVEPGKNLVGPTLFGVVGRKAGTEPGFKYSPAMEAAGWTWDPENLSAYIADPKKTLPGNRMAFIGLKNPEDVKAVVAYLETLK